jgi:hypothetical protein
MGSYTALWGEIKLNERGVKAFKVLLNKESKLDPELRWKSALLECFTQAEMSEPAPAAFALFCLHPYAYQIPYARNNISGCLGSPRFEEQITTLDDDGTLHLNCCVRDYDGLIKAFLPILPAIATEWHLKQRHEEQYERLTYHDFPEVEREEPEEEPHGYGF